MFINFSNHPSKLWAEDERNAALQYGTIEDLAFPQVPEGAVCHDLHYQSQFHFWVYKNTGK